MAGQTGMKGMAHRKDTACRQRHRWPASLSFCVRCTVLTAILLVLALFPGVSSLQESYRVVLWLSPTALAQAEPVKTKTAEEDKDSARLVQKIRTLLVPVYGDEHVVVQVNCGDAENNSSDSTGKKTGRTVAIIIDAAVLSGLNGSAEGIRAEQERLCNLVSHAAGLKGQNGDSIAVSFILFQNDETKMRLLYLIAAGCAVLMVLGLAWSLRNRRKGNKDSHFNDINARTVRKMADNDVPEREMSREESLAMKLQSESPQAGGLVIGMLAAKKACAVLEFLPDDACVNFLCAMYGQGPVRKDVLDIIQKEYLAGFPVDKNSLMRIARSGLGDAERRIVDILREFDTAKRKAIIKGISGQCPELGKRL